MTSNQGLTMEEYAELLDNVVVVQGSIKSDLETLMRAFKLQFLSRKGSIATICGEAGAGKTTLIETFVKQAQTYIDSKQKKATIVVMEAPEAPSGNALYRAMLIAAGSPVAHPGKLSKLKKDELAHEIKSIIKNKNIVLWIIDEGQHIAENLGDKIVRQAADALKSNTNKYPTLLVFVGLKSVLVLLDSNEQLESRGLILPKEKMHINSKKAYHSYLDYLATLQAQTGIPGIALDLPEIALPIFYDSRGDLRVITEIIQTALMCAFENNAMALEKCHFEESWSNRLLVNMRGKKAIKGNTFKANLTRLIGALDIDYEIE